ncbi:FRG domain-containing protein [Pectobacterium brasiliense]|uniref:FRG domain-containing protein n=1 Tax=Pectobacterium brasiliense TaxID=180957 RepID=UPI002A833652|nr:FRG domain-containing protein [Pectobacterium brasiliense]MDY4350749.1 FRG domain-containing protein [Pectobacterium brasiliense]
MKYIETDIFGRVVVPELFSEIFMLTAQHAGKRMNVYMWRGQGVIDWAIHSSAYRRIYRTKKRPIDERDMRYYEHILLKRARHQGYGFEQGRVLSDFELLAKLQHHGAATRLVDFSRNLLVALWFACRSDPEQTGLLFGIHTNTVEGLEGETEDRGYEEIFDNSKEGSTERVKSWQPPVITKRIAAQSAQFLYSEVCGHTMGSLAFDKSPETFLAFAITPEMKKNILLLLQGTFDIHQITMFPDIDGFSFANSAHFEQYSNERC